MNDLEVNIITDSNIRLVMYADDTITSISFNSLVEVEIKAHTFLAMVSIQQNNKNLPTISCTKFLTTSVGVC